MTLNITHWNGDSGNWGKGSNWSDGEPDAGSEAAIDASGAYGVTIAQGSTYAVGAVELNDAGATLALQGSLSVSQTVDLNAGTLALNVYGVLSGGTVLFDGGALASQAGTFDNVTAVGPFAMTGDFQSLRLTNAFSVTAAGGGAGQILLNGEDDTLTFEGSQTFDNATITMSGNGTSIFGGIIDGAGVLTLGPNATVTTAGIEAEEILEGSKIVNEGTIVSAAGSFFGIEISPATFVNGGVVVADNLTWAKGRVFTNAAGGEIDIAAGENLIVEGSFHNEGRISLGAGARLELRGAVAVADLGSIQNGGEVDLQGTLLNQGQVLTLGRGPLAGAVSITGTILGGIVRPGSAGDSQALESTLDGVTWRGALALGGSQLAYLTVENGLNLTRANGSGRGAATVDASTGAIYFLGSQTLDQATIELGAGTGGDSLMLESPRKGTASTLTLGPDLLVESKAAGSRDTIGQSLGGGPGTIINEGRILVAAAQSTFAIFDDSFVNSGTILATNGDQLTFSPVAMTNTGLIRASGGAAIEIGVGSGETVGTFANGGTIAIAAGCDFTLLADASLAGLGGMSDKGTFTLAGVLDASGAAVKLAKSPVLGGEALVLDLGGFLENGTFQLGQSNILYNSGGFANATMVGAVQLTAAGAIASFGGAVSLVGPGGHGAGVINVTGAGATLNFYDPKGVNSNGVDNVTITIGNASTTANLDLFSYSSKPQTLTLGAGVRIVSSENGALAAIGAVFGVIDTVVNQGLISASASGGRFTISDALVNDGSLVIGNGDTLVLQQALSGNGSVSIATGGVLEIGKGAGGGETIAFSDATGLLRLDQASSFAATIAGLTAGDVIDLVGLTATAASVNGADQLIVTNGATNVALLQLSGDYSHASFKVASDGHGGTKVTLTGAAMAFSHAAASVTAVSGSITGPASAPSRLATIILARPA